MKTDFKNNIKNSIKKESQESISNVDIKEESQELNENTTITFKIGKKQEDKSVRKSFPLYVDGVVQKELDKIVKRTGYSRNELINMMIQHCLDTLEFID
ncbi:TPA: CopG family transcriptional regulator [Clostridium botulinum]|nr:CopG family transcriptional regulator [Clostridium botulinum]